MSQTRSEPDFTKKAEEVLDEVERCLNQLRYVMSNSPAEQRIVGEAREIIEKALRESHELSRQES